MSKSQAIDFALPARFAPLFAPPCVAAGVAPGTQGRPRSHTPLDSDFVAGNELSASSRIRKMGFLVLVSKTSEMASRELQWMPGRDFQEVLLCGLNDFESVLAIY